MTYAVYTDYESDKRGDYTYFLGEEVELFEGLGSSSFESLTISIILVEMGTFFHLVEAAGIEPAQGGKKPDHDKPPKTTKNNKKSKG